MLTRGVNSIAVLIVAILLYSGTALAQVKRDQKEMGVIDARKWNFADDRLPLNGYWTFFKNKLIEPSSIVAERGAFVHFPKLFNDIGLSNKGTGCATFHLILLLPDSIDELEFEIPQLYNAYKLWVNNEVVASAGQVGTTPEETHPSWCYKKVPFKATTDTLHITLHVANFHHYKGGAKEIIYLGKPAQIDKHWSWSFGATWTHITFLFLEFLIFILIYYNNRKKVVLYFALLCLVWSVRAIFSGLYPITNIFPDFNWNVMVKVEYLTLYGAVIFSILFLDAVFKNLRTQLITYLLVGINIFFFLYTLVSTPLAFTRWVNVYLTVAGITIGYGTIIVIRALLFEQAGAWFLMISLLCGAFVFGYDIVAYGSATGYNFVFLHGGYIVIFLLITVSLLYNLGVLKSHSTRTDILTYNDMFKSETLKR